MSAFLLEVSILLRIMLTWAEIIKDSWIFCRPTLPQKWKKSRWKRFNWKNKNPFPFIIFAGAFASSLRDVFGNKIFSSKNNTTSLWGQQNRSQTRPSHWTSCSSFTMKTHHCLLRFRKNNRTETLYERMLSQNHGSVEHVSVVER